MTNNGPRNTTQKKNSAPQIPDVVGLVINPRCCRVSHKSPMLWGQCCSNVFCVVFCGSLFLSLSFSFLDVFIVDKIKLNVTTTVISSSSSQYCCVVLLCVFMFWVPCCDVRYDFRFKTKFGSSLLSVVHRSPHVLFLYLYLFVIVSNTYCVVFIVVFVFVL